jgi:GDP-mannose 6-dehydrogenase
MKPGFAFGGSCLPKDVRALKAKARELDVASPILDAMMVANEEQIQSAYRLVQASGKRTVGILGLSFKSDTDDLRESPMVVLTERLLGKGFVVKVYDPNIRLSRLTGTNLRYVQEYLPHISRMLHEEPEEVLASDVLVVSHKELGTLLTPSMFDEKHIIDLARLFNDRLSEGKYQGICW